MSDEQPPRSGWVPEAWTPEPEAPEPPHATTPAHDGQPSFGTSPTYGAQPGYGTPSTYGAQPGYGPPSTYGAQPGHETPATFGSQPGYGAPPFYGTPQAYGAQPGYGAFPGRGAYAQPNLGLPASERESDKSFVATWLLAWLLGWLGIDRFYLGRTGTAVLKLVTLGGCGVWALIDLILVLAGVTKDEYGRTLSGYHQHKKLAWIVTGSVFALELLARAVVGAVPSDGVAAPAVVVVPWSAVQPAQGF